MIYKLFRLVRFALEFLLRSFKGPLRYILPGFVTDSVDIESSERSSSFMDLAAFRTISGDDGYSEKATPYHGPDCRSGHRIFITDDYLYVIGGFDRREAEDATTAGYIYKDMWAMNLITNQWKEVRIADRRTFPIALASFAICQLKPYSSEFILYGGTGIPFGQAASQKTFLLSVDEKNLVVYSTELETIGFPMPRLYGHALVRENTLPDEISMFCIGGTTGQDFYYNVYNLTYHQNDNVWEWKRVGIPENQHDGLYRLEAVHDGDELIMFGGGKPHLVNSFDKLSVFNIKTNKYDKIDTIPDCTNAAAGDGGNGFPTSRRCHSVTKWGRNVIVAGGCGEDIQTDTGRRAEIREDVWSFNLDTRKWTKFHCKLHLNVFFHDAAVSRDGCLYIFGGVVDETSEFRSNLCQAVCLEPPSLLKIASRTVTSSLPEERLHKVEEVLISEPLTMFRATLSVAEPSNALVKFITMA